MKEYNLDYFLDKKWSFVLVKNSRIIYKSRQGGLKPLIFSLKRYKKELRQATVFDKIVGRAAALLLVYGKVKEILTSTISQEGLRILQKNKVKVLYNNKVKNILNKDGNGLCPMEAMSWGKMAKEICRILGIL